MGLPGVKLNTSATDFAPIEQLQMMQFKGERWELFGPDHQRRDRRLTANAAPRKVRIFQF